MKYILGVLFMGSVLNGIEVNLTHGEKSNIDQIENKIRTRGDLAYISVEEQLSLLQKLAQFEVGRFLIERRGLNGYWTDYVIHHPCKGRITGLNSEGKPFTEIELFLMNLAPTSLATQQRFEIFKKEIQKRVFDGISLASIPCGLTADLLDLDYSGVRNYLLCGIDIDSESLSLSEQISKDKKLEDHCQFIQKDAWSLDFEEKFDLISSNGLSIYEVDNAKVVDLYRQFYLALKPNGLLITSFLTSPPMPGSKTEWDMKSVNLEHALLQKIIFADILDCKWQVFRSEKQVISQLAEAGFTEIEVVYDEAKIFPTVVAKK